MNETQKAALAYIRRGWWVLPIQPGTKKPLAVLVPNGVHGATNDPDVAIDWWGRYPDAGIGIAVKPSGLVCIDIDPRNGGFETMQRLEAEHGPLVSDIYAFTGGGGQHLVCSSQQVENLPGTLGKGVDLKSDGYFCAYPTIHPNGVRYEWEASSDPIECVDAVPSMFPGWVRDLSRPSVAASSAWAQAVSSQRAEQRFATITPEQQAEIGEALAAIPSDEREVWLQVGMALQSTGDAQWAFDAWCEWSAQSDKFNAQDQIRVWRSFAARGLDGLTYRSIFELAKQHGTVVRPVPVSAPAIAVDALDDVGLQIAQERQQEIDPTLLRPPGVLGDVTDWINATSFHLQPQFAVQAALAFAATVLGRRFMTTQNNCPNLYLVNIAKSGGGKEYTKKAIEELLRACGLESLIGPSGYTSESGLISALLERPNHVTVMDEMHRVLEVVRSNNNSHGKTMVTALMSVFSKLDGTIRLQARSTLGLSQRDRENAKERSVDCPSITLMGLAVPEFWETIGSAASRDGFLNRFLFVESSEPRQRARRVRHVEVPATVLTWAEDVRSRYQGLLDPDMTPHDRPDFVVLDFSPKAYAVIDALDDEAIRLQDEHDADGMAPMFTRMREIAMRISLIVALSCGRSRIEEEDMQWAALYTKTYTRQAVQKLAEHVADSDIEAASKQVLGLLLKQGARGLTKPDIYKRSRRWRSLYSRGQADLLETLRQAGLAVEVEIKTDSGRTRKAWVAVEHLGDRDGYTPIEAGDKETYATSGVSR